MWVLTYKATNKIHLIGHGAFDPLPHDMGKLDYYEIPDQPVDHLYQGDPPELVGVLDDLKLYSEAEKLALVDKDTAKQINDAIHPFAPTDEQIGILRDQITHLLNEIGMDPTEDFVRLNDVATAAIEAAQPKKEALDENNAITKS